MALEHCLWRDIQRRVERVPQITDDLHTLGLEGTRHVAGKLSESWFNNPTRAHPYVASAAAAATAVHVLHSAARIEATAKRVGDFGSLKCPFGLRGLPFALRWFGLRWLSFGLYLCPFGLRLCQFGLRRLSIGLRRLLMAPV